MATDERVPDDDDAEVGDLLRRHQATPSGLLDAAAIAATARRRAWARRGIGAAAAVVVLVGGLTVVTDDDRPDQIEAAGDRDEPTTTSSSSSTTATTLAPTTTTPAPTTTALPTTSTSPPTTVVPTTQASTTTSTTVELPPATSPPDRTEPTSPPAESRDSFTIDLMTRSSPYDGPLAPVPVRLRNDPDLDGGCAWLEHPDSGTQLTTLWPPGWTARFDRVADGSYDVTVFDRAGQVQLRSGEIFYTSFGESRDPAPRCLVSDVVIAPFPSFGDAEGNGPPADVDPPPTG